MFTPARVSVTILSSPRPHSRRFPGSASTVTGSRSTALPPGSASRQQPDASNQKVPDQDMARQPDDKTLPEFKSGDGALIRELALLLDETGLTEIEIERAGLRVRVARSISIAASVPPSQQPAAAVPAAAAPVEVTDVAKHPGVVPAPMVGPGSWPSD